MVKGQFGRFELDYGEYLNFLDGASAQRYVYPVRSGGIYVASELPAFFQSAQIELERLLSQIQHPNTEPLDTTDGQALLNEFCLMSHGKTGANRDGKLTGWSGDMLCHSYEKSGKWELGGIELAKAQAGILPQDKVSIDLVKKMRVPSVDIKDYAIIFVHDLPRAIHHAALLTRDEDVEKETEAISQRIDKEIKENGNIFSVRIYQDLNSLALRCGFIPVPLIRAQYYGPMELGPEKLKIEQKKAFVDKTVADAEIRFQTDKKHFDKDKARLEAEEFADALIQRKDLLYAQREQGGRYITENRFDLVQRLDQFYSTVTQRVGTGRILVVTSSGCIDVTPSIFRYYEDKSRTEIQTPTTKTRGNVVLVQFGTVGNKPCYLNDSAKIEPLRQAAKKRIDNLRNLSIDSLVCQGEAIIETPLLGFKKTDLREQKYEPYKENFAQALLSSEPIIIFGHGGQGKSILSTVIAENFLKGGYGKEFEGYIPVMLNCEDINREARSNKKKTGEENLASILMPDVSDLPPAMQKSQRFAFIIDDYQKLSNDYTSSMQRLEHDLRAQGHVVVLLSRLERPDMQPPHNSGYKTMQIDTDAVASDNDQFIEGRIDPENADAFKSYLKQYDSSITGHYQTKLFLTKIFPGAAGRGREVVDYILDPRIAELICQGEKLNQYELFDAYTDFQTGLDIEKLDKDGRMTLGDIRKEIKQWKMELARAAHDEIYLSGI